MHYVITFNIKQMKDLKIEIPEGFEVDEEKSTFTNIVFKAVKKELPKSYEELELVNGWWIDQNSDVYIAINAPISGAHRNVFPTKELAEAALALAQLLQLRDKYNGDWKPDWTDNSTKYCIYAYMSIISKEMRSITQHVLAFETRNLRNDFLTNFKDLLEIAKPLL